MRGITVLFARTVGKFPYSLVLMTRKTRLPYPLSTGDIMATTMLTAQVLAAAFDGLG